MATATNTRLETRNQKGQHFYDLEERTLAYAKNIRSFLALLPNNIITNQDIKQLVRSSGSVGANYIEANESLSKKDFLMRIKISKKEARESIFWLKLLVVPQDKKQLHNSLIQETEELVKILGAILSRSKLT